MGKRGPPSKTILPWQAAFMRKAWRIRRSLTNSALADILGLTEKQVKNYTGGLYRRISATTVSRWENGYPIPDDIAELCDEALQAARRIAAERGGTVVLEDDDGNWAVSPTGETEKLPESWA